MKNKINQEKKDLFFFCLSSHLINKTKNINFFVPIKKILI